MPTYDYTCQACGRELEIFQSMTRRILRKPFTSQDVESLLEQLLRSSTTLHAV